MPTNPTPEQLIAQVASNQKHERHLNYRETVYWCRQWRLSAEQLAVALTAALERIQELENQLTSLPSHANIERKHS
jgi:transposase-like protein